MSPARPSAPSRSATSPSPGWGDRLASDWRPHTLEQNQAILDGLGLNGEFWRLA